MMIYPPYINFSPGKKSLKVNKLISKRNIVNIIQTIQYGQPN